ncbi:MAG: replication-associated recombination protein A [Coriobacteriales bacterium]|jgi:putative ATPase|nr:replication-associated recombination protein A [Coriobacteriales bacterium]
MDNLFTPIENEALLSVAPLAVRMRPRTLDDLVGQREVVGEGTWLRGAIEGDTLSSIILFGPAGTGKTTLARIIAGMTRANFTEVSAISGGVSDLRRVIEEAKRNLTLQEQRTILFVDEIHRFSRSQQDALLHAVEDRIVILIGATTENPFFEVNSALISRSRVIEFKTLTDEDVSLVLDRALSDERGLAGVCELTDEARAAIINMAGGDARSALTTLELAAELATSALSHAPDESLAHAPGVLPLAVITLDDVLGATPRRALPYDKKGDVHYDVISAFIKSMRGSDPDAAVYWLARMIEGGEDPRFIARRMLIFASEDVGNADPQALLIAQAAFKAAESIGYPECQLNFAQAAIYLALAPKSNSATNAIFAALGEVRSGPLRAVPNHLRDRHRPGSEGYGKYHYPHLDARGYVEQHYLPDGLQRGSFYAPGERGWEAWRVEAVQRDRPALTPTPDASPSSNSNPGFQPDSAPDSDSDSDPAPDPAPDSDSSPNPSPNLSSKPTSDPNLDGAAG